MDGRNDVKSLGSGGDEVAREWWMYGTVTLLRTKVGEGMARTVSIWRQQADYLT